MSSEVTPPPHYTGRKYALPLKSSAQKLTWMAEYRKRPEVVARQREYLKQWRKAHPDRQRLPKGMTSSDYWKQVNARRKEYTRAWKRGHLLARYGLTLDAYAQLMEAQGGKCAMPFCQRSGRLVVDHDHVTGVVRGLLCIPCNAFLGFFDRHPDLVRHVRAYLGRSEAVS